MVAAIRDSSAGSAPSDAPTIADYQTLTPHPDRQTGGARDALSQPAVTLITGVWNCAQHLAATFASIAGQTFQDFEYIVIDGGSTDGSIDVMRAHESLITRWISEPDNGAYDAMNKGIALARGRYIKILNGDDLLPPGSIERAVAELDKSPVPCLVRGDLGIVDQSEREIARVSAQYWDGPFLPPQFPVLHPGWYLPKTIYERLGLYSTRYRIASDWEYLFRLLQNDVPVVHVDEVMAYFRTGGLSAASSSGLWEGLEISARYLGMPKAGVLFARSAAKRSLSTMARRVMTRQGTARVRSLIKKWLPGFQDYI